MIRIIALIVLSVCCLPPVTAQTSSSTPSDVMRQLLSMPAPTPRPATTETPRKGYPPEFFDREKPPPDDSPIEDLLAYWPRGSGNSDPQPSAAVAARLLDACLSDPKLLPELLPLLSKTEATATKIKELYDKALAHQEDDNSWREKVREWLLLNSKYFIRDLQGLAGKAKDKDGYVEHEEALRSLADLDWPSAEPILQNLVNGVHPRSSALALTLLYQQARKASDAESEEKYRSNLKIIAADKNAPARARAFAIETLSLTDWSGRDEWYLSLLEDGTLLETTDGYTLFHPLQTLFNRDPDKWIPVMAKLVESKDRAVQQAAASCLVIYATHHPRRDAILPVLRWLSEPDWIDINGTQRAWFMQTMDDLEIPESVPGLIWIVENEDSNVIWAARTLARYKDVRAVPALKKALAESSEDNRQYILEGLLASGGVSEPEQVAALEAYATKLTTAEGREDVQGYRSYRATSLPIPVSIGKYLATKHEASESLVRAVLARAEVLKKTDSLLAQSLLAVAHQWRSRQIDLDLISRIASSTADAATIVKALERRVELHESVGSELQALNNNDGTAQGIAAVLLEDNSLAESVLSSGGESAQIALLACARLTQMALPVETVGALLSSKNELLAAAAERYLLVEDSRAARELVWARYPGQAFITGWRENIALTGDNFDVMGKVEEKLRGELFEEKGPIQIYALIPNNENYAHVLRVYRNQAVYTLYEDPTRYRERVIANQELATFKDSLAAYNVEDLGPQFSHCYHNCFSEEFLALTKEKGRRVFSHQAHWKKIFLIFETLGRGENARTRYALEKEIKGLEVLYADDNLSVLDVWQAGADIRVFVERGQMPEETAEQERISNSSDEVDESIKANNRLRQISLKQARFSWRSFANNKLGAVTTQPEGYSTFDSSRFPPDDDDGDPSSGLNEHRVQLITADTVVFSRNFDGLWRQTAGRKAVRISGEEGAYANPIVTPNGKWVVVAKTDSDWSKPNYIVRFNLQTGREHRVALPPADQFNPVTYVAPLGKVLLRRAKDDDRPADESVGPKTPEYYLLDAATGQTQLTSGVFTPLFEDGKRALQPTRKPNQVWVAISNQVKNQTQVGRYNLKNFSFEPLLVVPHISFDSMSMWVDEGEGKLYLVYKGQLLRLPLQSVEKSTTR